MHPLSSAASPALGVAVGGWVGGCSLSQQTMGGLHPPPPVPVPVPVPPNHQTTHGNNNFVTMFPTAQQIENEVCPGHQEVELVRSLTSSNYDATFHPYCAKLKLEIVFTLLNFIHIFFFFYLKLINAVLH